MTLIYQSTAAVPDDIRERILRAARRGQPRGGWWAEGIAWEPPSKRGRLRGSAKLMRLDVEPEFDVAMALRDWRVILRRLIWWSFRYGIEWSLSFDDGKPIGSIRRGMPSGLLLRRLGQFAIAARVIARSPVLTFVRRRALRTNPSRHE